MNTIEIAPDVVYVGADDTTIDLFESQYAVPNGVSYNSYVILDEKIAVLDTVDRRAADTYFENLKKVLGDRQPDYLVVHHMEPDHAAEIQKFLETYPTAKVVGNAKTFTMLSRFFTLDVSGRSVTVKEGDTLSLGEHQLTFYMAPMVHWPEVMVSYETKDKILFSADGFGKFGALAVNDDWEPEARRYYFNIVGKYGAQVQALLKKAAGLEIRAICPLHGPVLRENLSYYLNLYDIWSRYEPQCKGVLIAYASIHGNTRAAAQKLAQQLAQKGETNVTVMDLARCDLSQAVETAFRYDRLVAASATYDGGLFPCMEDFLSHLKAKNFQKRKVALIENGTWAPMAGKLMRAAFESMKQITLLEPMVTIPSAMKEQQVAELDKLAEALL